MVTVPAHSFRAPVLWVVTAARRCIPRVWAVASSSSADRIIRTPSVRHRLDLRLIGCLHCSHGHGRRKHAPRLPRVANRGRALEPTSRSSSIRASCAVGTHGIRRSGTRSTTAPSLFRLSPRTPTSGSQVNAADRTAGVRVNAALLSAIAGFVACAAARAYGPFVRRAQ